MLLIDSWLAALAAIGLTAARFAEKRYGRMAAGAAILLFCLNPLFVSLPILALWAYAILAVLFATVFSAAWFYMDHWSAFMRTLVLIVLFALGSAVHAWSVGVVALSMISWIVLSRRRWPAAVSAVLIVVAGTVLHLIVLGLWLVATKHGSFKAPWLAMGLAFEVVKINILEHGSSAVVLRRVLLDIGLTTVAWSALSFWMVVGILKRAATDRRADVRTMMATLTCLAYAAGLLSTSFPFFSMAMLATSIAMTAPIIAAEFSRKEYTHHRSARWAVALGLLGGLLPGPSLQNGTVLRILTERLVVQGVTIIVMGIAAALWPVTAKLAWRLRWRGVLLGAYGGAVLLALLNR